MVPWDSFERHEGDACFLDVRERCPTLRSPREAVAVRLAGWQDLWTAARLGSGVHTEFGGRPRGPLVRAAVLGSGARWESR